MAWTQQHLDQLNEALATGAQEIEYSDKKVRYRGLKEMLQIKAQMMAELHPPTRSKATYPKFNRGF